MRKNLLSFYYYEYTCPEDLINEILKKAESAKWVHLGGFNQGTKDNIFKHDQLESWINDCLKDLQSKEYPNLRAELKVTQAWLNKSQKMEMHHKHHHPNSIVSGIIYLNTINNGGETVFYYPNPFWKLSNERIFSFSKTHSEVEIRDHVTSVSGKMIIFPSSIEHSTMPFKDNGVRYTVAFNTFFFGQLGLLEDATYLHLS